MPYLSLTTARQLEQMMLEMMTLTLNTTCQRGLPPQVMADGEKRLTAIKEVLRKIDDLKDPEEVKAYLEANE